jgi:hypothetical protein
MKTIMTCLMLFAFASPVHAGHGTIEETDDGYIVEYSGDATDKTDKPARKPGEKQLPLPIATPATKPAVQESSAQDDWTPATQRPAKIRDQSRRERTQLVPRASPE